MKAALRDFKDIARDAINQTMLSVDPAGPEPGQVPLQRLGLAGAFKGMTQTVLEECVHLPKHSAVGVLPVEHPVKPGRVTVAGKDSDDLAQGTYNSNLKQAKLKGP